MTGTVPARGPVRSGIGLGPADLTVRHRLLGPAVALVTVLAAGLVAVAHRADPLAAAGLVAVVACHGRLSLVDLTEQRLPNRITLPLAAATVGAVLVDGAVGGAPGAALAAVASGLGLAGLLLVLRFGAGDVKLALTVGTLAAHLGGDAAVATALIASASGAVGAVLVLLATRRRTATFGFGPCLALGSVAGMLTAGP